MNWGCSRRPGPHVIGLHMRSLLDKANVSVSSYQSVRRCSCHLRPGCLVLAQARRYRFGREKAVSEFLEVDSLWSPQAVLGLGLQGVHVKKLRFSQVTRNDNH
jgi:hypothetical protein